MSTTNKARGGLEERGPIDSGLLFGQILAVWHSVNTIPSGVLRRAPSASVCTVGPPRSGFQAGCPRSFGEFLSRGAFGVSEADAFAWYSRMKLRYSCSSLSCTFVSFVVPELERAGIREMTLPWGGTLHLTNLRVVEVAMDPNLQTHAIELSRMFSDEWASALLAAADPKAAAEEERRWTAKMSKIALIKDHVHPLTLSDDGEFIESQLVERTTGSSSTASLGDPLRVSHNALQCTESGVVVDFSLGQFTGVMNPVVYPNKQAFISKLPSDVLAFYSSPQSEIDGQNARDESTAAKSPDLSPKKFAKRVVHSCKAVLAAAGRTGFCDHCFGEVPKLLSCSQRRRVSYCGVPCQRLHWKQHKAQCKKC